MIGVFVGGAGRRVSTDGGSHELQGSEREGRWSTITPIHYAVAGTPNLLEYLQGFFVKQGDGAAEFRPIAHRYRPQVCALVEYPEEPQERLAWSPTTDTFSLSQPQQEFDFAVPFRDMDLGLWVTNRGVPAQKAGSAIGSQASRSSTRSATSRPSAG